MTAEGEPGYFEREMYLAAASKAVLDDERPVRSMSPAEMLALGVDAAVAKDRTRMAEMIRSRVIVAQIEGLPPRIAMKVEEVLFKLATQVENGMPYYH